MHSVKWYPPLYSLKWMSPLANSGNRIVEMKHTIQEIWVYNYMRYNRKGNPYLVINSTTRMQSDNKDELYVWGLLSAHIDPPIIVSETIKIVRIRLNTFVLQIDWKATVNSLAKLRLSNAILYRSRQHCWIEYFMITSHCWHHERGIWRISNKTGHFCII